MHHRCSGITGRLVADPDYVCPRCRGVARPIDGRPVTCVEVDGTPLDVEASFCYLGDMLCSGGGCDRAIAARCCAAWGKFRRLLPLLTNRHLSLKTRGRIFNACVRSTMLHGSETWATKSSDLQRLRRNDRAMIRWICGVGIRDNIDTAALLQRLNIADITTSLRARRLRWFGHVRRASSCTGSITEMTVIGQRGCGRPRKTWLDCVEEDIGACGLPGVEPLVREAWRAGVRQCLVLPTPATGTTAAP